MQLKKGQKIIVISTPYVGKVDSELRGIKCIAEIFAHGLYLKDEDGVSWPILFRNLRYIPLSSLALLFYGDQK